MQPGVLEPVVRVPPASFTPVIRPHIRGYRLDGDLILFDGERTKLFALNSTASFIWGRLAAGCTTGEIAAQLSARTDAPTPRVAGDIDALLTEWKRAGIVEAENDPPARIIDAPARVCAAPCAPAARRMSSPRPSIFSRAYPVTDAGIRVTCDADLAAAVDALFGHVACAKGEADDTWPVLEACRRDRSWVVSCAGTVLGVCTDRSEIAPLIHANASLLIYRASSCFVAIHAAGVSRDSRVVLMPGLPGSGKSTLTAALIAAGYDYCTDDLAILAEDPMRVRPLPLPIGLKSGAWPVLEPRWPELARLPVHRRADGRLIKYLLPPRERVAAPAGFTVTDMVFPRFAAGERARWRPIARSDALVRMAEAGYDLPGTLDHAAVRTLVEWFESLHCYELTFDDLDEAVELFSSGLE